MSSPQSTLSPSGPAAAILAHLGWVVYIVFGIITVTTLVILLLAVLRQRGSLAWHAPWDTGGGQHWVVIGGLLIPIVVLCGIFVLSLERERDFPLRDGRRVTPEIQVIGHQWWWEVHYLTGPADQHFVTANEIHIPVGKPIDIAVQSADVVHSFWVPALHGKVQMIPGLTNYIRIEADEPGSYKGECANFCGQQHAHMRLLVVADPPEKYQAWRRDQISPADPPHGADAQHGEQVFMNAACTFCHTINGTDAQGKVAPDLTHLASRQYIAANSYGNDTADLEAWVTHAQSLKPGCLMPNITRFNGVDLRDMVDYLRELK